MSIAPRAPNGERLEFAARLASLPATAAFAQDFCARHRIPHPLALRLTLVIEELFTNTVTHGHGGDCERQVAITLAAADDGVALCYEDEAPPFDPLPFMHTPPESLDAPAPTREPGGLGLHLVGQMASRVRHRYADGNRICLTLPAPHAAGHGD